LKVLCSLQNLQVDFRLAKFKDFVKMDHCYFQIDLGQRLD